MSQTSKQFKNSGLTLQNASSRHFDFYFKSVAFITELKSKQLFDFYIVNTQKSGVFLF
jgi:hypothetical protein